MACCKPERACGSRYYQELQVQAGDQRNVMGIHSDCGSGYLEMWSPDCYVTWTVRQQFDGNPDTRVFKTGPASKAGIFLVAGGEVTCTVDDVNLVGSVQEYNGFITRTQNYPYFVNSRFYPCQSTRAKITSQRFVTTGNGAGYDRAALPAGAATAVAFPPNYSKSCAYSTDSASTVEVVDARSGVVRQSRAVGATPGAVPVAVNAWEYIRVTPAGPAPCNISILWSEETEIYF